MQSPITEAVNHDRICQSFQKVTSDASCQVPHVCLMFASCLPHVIWVNFALSLDHSVIIWPGVSAVCQLMLAPGRPRVASLIPTVLQLASCLHLRILALQGLLTVSLQFCLQELMPLSPVYALDSL